VPKIAHQPPGSSRIGRVAAPSGVAGGGRDRAIDVLRGLCIVSMTTAHLAAGSRPWQVFHLGTFVDGAVGFGFLSGLVLGMTQRRTIDRGRPARRAAKAVAPLRVDLRLCDLPVPRRVRDRRRQRFPIGHVSDRRRPRRTALGRLRYADPAVPPALHLHPVAVCRAAADERRGRRGACVPATLDRRGRLGAALRRRVSLGWSSACKISIAVRSPASDEGYAKSRWA
jgi:hypothetical protein